MTGGKVLVFLLYYLLWGWHFQKNWEYIIFFFSKFGKYSCILKLFCMFYQLNTKHYKLRRLCSIGQIQGLHVGIIL